jgi:hypothetical protein
MVGLSALVAAACVLASLWRLAVAVAPISFDAGELRRAVTGPRAIASLRAALGAEARAHWEQDLFAAFAEHDGGQRDALVNELLTEVDGLTGAWSRVPRICASLATSCGFLFASVSLLRSWGGAQAPPAIGLAIVSAVDAFSIGVMAAAFCVVIHVRAARAARDSLSAIDRLVERMQSVSEPLGATVEADRPILLRAE